MVAEWRPPCGGNNKPVGETSAGIAFSELCLEQIWRSSSLTAASITFMRPFWQSIALLMLVLFAPASMHCLMNAAMADGPASDVSCASSQSCGDTDHAPLPQSPEQEHQCPTDTLAKTNLPAGVMVPAIPSMVLEDALAALRRVATDLLSNGDASTAAPPAAPKELQPTWAFTSRAALPARWPSDLA